MTVRRLAHFSLSQLRPVLEDAGWDVECGDALSAEVTDAHGHFRLTVDKSGRILLKFTTMMNHSPGKVIHTNGRTYALQSESFDITHVATTIASISEFDQALSDMMSLALPAS